MSATHFSFGRVAVKSRCSRSRARSSAASSAIVVRRFLPRCTPSSPSWRISRATRSRPTSTPRRFSSFQVLRTPYTRRSLGRSARPRRRPVASPRSSSPSPGRVELRREKHRCVLQDRVRPTQLRVLLTQPLQLITLLRCQQITPATAISLRLPHPVPQRLLMHAQISGDVHDRPPRLEHQPNRALTELL